MILNVIVKYAPEDNPCYSDEIDWWTKYKYDLSHQSQNITQSQQAKAGYTNLGMKIAVLWQGGVSNTNQVPESVN